MAHERGHVRMEEGLRRPGLIEPRSYRVVMTSDSKFRKPGIVPLSRTVPYTLKDLDFRILNYSVFEIMLKKISFIYRYVRLYFLINNYEY